MSRSPRSPARSAKLCKRPTPLLAIWPTLLALTALLAGCGGNAPGAASAPVLVATAPVPTPSPSPTASPATGPTPLPGSAALTQTGDFSVLSYAVTGPTSLAGAGQLSTRLDGVAFRYTAALRHELVVPGKAMGVLGPPSLVTPELSGQTVTVGEGPSASTFGLNLFIPGSRNPTLAMQYTGYGSWYASAVSASDPNRIDQNWGAFAYGIPTSAAAMASSGSALYTGLLFDDYNVPGKVSIRIDFGTGVVSGTIEPAFTAGLGCCTTIGAFPFQGLLRRDSSAIAISFAASAAGQNGTLDLQLTGPNAEELMLRWSAVVVVPTQSALPTLQSCPASRVGSNVLPRSRKIGRYTPCGEGL